MPLLEFTSGEILIAGPGESSKRSKVSSATGALFEYLIQVPANRIGFQVMNLGQLKILQEVITLSVFVPFFDHLYMKEEFRLDYLWAGLCILGAVFFLFREKLFGA